MNEDAQELGKYTIVETLGRGGFATVFRAHDTVLKRDIALKIMHPALMADRTFVTRFENDARAAAQLEHPNIVTIYELGQLESRLYIAMQYLAHGTLHDRIEGSGQLSLDECVRIVSEVAGALDHAHERGFVHRDVKPTNILFNGQDVAILSDFGLVTVAEKSIVALSTAGGVIGTPAYIPPEVWEGKESSPATDVYALGCVIFEMLMGEELFKGDTSPATMMSHFQPRQYPDEWPAGVPARVEGVLERALAQNPADRFQRAGDLAEALTALSDEAGDPLFEQYHALRTALDEEAWDRALNLARDIADENPDYRDVQALMQQAVEGQAQSEQARWATRWREQAQTAEDVGNVDAARAAAQRWLEFAPEDPDAKAMVDRLDDDAASEPVDAESVPQPERDATAEPATGKMSRPPDEPSSTRPDQRQEVQRSANNLPDVSIGDRINRFGVRAWGLLGIGILLVILLMIWPSVGGNLTGILFPAAMEEVPMDESAAEESGDVLPVVDPGEVTGIIRIAGSPTMIPVTELLMQMFHDDGYSGESSIVPTDTVAGFQQLCVDGSVEIAAADRSYTDEEVQQCSDNGIELVEFRIGTDAAVVIVNQQNDWMDGASKDEIAALFTDAVGWSDVHTEWPDDAVARILPAEDKSSFDLFTNAILDGDRDRLLNADRTLFLDDESEIVHQVIDDPHALGFLGVIPVLDHLNEVRILSIEGVEPMTDTLGSGEYLLSRPLFLYTAAGTMREQPQVAAFINYALQHANEKLPDVEELPLSDAMLDSARQTWLAVMATANE